MPDLHAVARTNFCDIGVIADPASGRCVVVSAIDNLVKGAAGQAIQNLNLALGFDETAGLLVKALIKIGGSLLDDPASRQRHRAADCGGRRVGIARDGRAWRRQADDPLSRRARHPEPVRGRAAGHDGRNHRRGAQGSRGNREYATGRRAGAAGAKAVGLTGIDAGLATAEQLDPELGFVGRVTASDPRVARYADGARVICPLSPAWPAERDGQVFNVNGDSMAVAIASSWQVDRLVFLTDVPGVLDAQKSIIPVLTIAGLPANLIDAGVATGGMQAKLNAATDAVADGVQEVRIVKGFGPRYREARVRWRRDRHTNCGPHHDPLRS